MALQRRSVRSLSPRQSETLYLEVLYELDPELYDSLWFPGIYCEELIDRAVSARPGLHRIILDKMTDRGTEEGFVF